jgi:hypothetical protein
MYYQKESAALHTVEIQGDFLKGMKQDHRIQLKIDKEMN